MMFSGGGGTWLRFSKGPYIYTIFSATGKQAQIGAGIGFLSGVHMLPPDQAAPSASQVDATC
jgi:hypothetical protein